MLDLRDLGWDPFFDPHLESLNQRGLLPARVLSESHEIYKLATAHGELRGELSGNLRYRTDSSEGLPVAGDWVGVQTWDELGIIHTVLPRRTALVRRAAGKRGDAQALGANVDTLFVVASLDRDFNRRRLERYLTLAADGGVAAVVVLTKLDLCDDPSSALAAARLAAPAAPIHAVSAPTDVGRKGLEPHLEPGRTIAFAGSSGAGKTTLLNWLAGEPLGVTSTVREHDGRGRHTTTRRELCRLPSGALVLDMPGLRELQLAPDEASLDEVFDDVATFAASCRFRDCRHRGEPGCAVARAVRDGLLPKDRLESYGKLRSEASFLALRETLGAAGAEKRRWKALTASAATRR